MITQSDDGPDFDPDDPLAIILRPSSDRLGPPPGQYEAVRRGAARRRLLRAAAGVGLSCAVAVVVALPFRLAASQEPASPAVPLAPPPATGPATAPTPSASPTPVGPHPTERPRATAAPTRTSPAGPSRAAVPTQAPSPERSQPPTAQSAEPSTARNSTDGTRP
ncbi:hypothetical protein [Streptomyces sp. NPDC058371]|uniref:hypothetical protein n=1 Tax=Streptomyces sp. NPDC058371 TaxID=3346463 RepID=UPI00364AEEA6